MWGYRCLWCFAFSLYRQYDVTVMIVFHAEVSIYLTENKTPGRKAGDVCDGVCDCLNARRFSRFCICPRVSRSQLKFQTLLKASRSGWRWIISSSETWNTKKRDRWIMKRQQTMVSQLSPSECSLVWFKVFGEDREALRKSNLTFHGPGWGRGWMLRSHRHGNVADHNF